MTDSSDESATEGVGPVQNDASDSESSADSQVEDQGNGFLDVEASESGDSDSESSEDSSDEESDYDDILGAGSCRRAQPKAVFTQFKKLPIELRHRIWQYFCPDLDRSPRVLSFQMVCSPTQDVIWESTTLDNQIRAVDAMLGLHQESREIALKAFPDTLAIRQGRRIVHFNKERDILHINGHKKDWAHNAVIPGFSENVLHLAADINYFQLKEMETLAAFPEVINFYKFEWHNEGRPPKKLRWCASDKIHRYEIQQLQRECRIGEDLHFVYCWPDVDKHPEFAAKHASEQFVATDGLDELHDELRETIMEGDPDLDADNVGEWDVMFEQLRDIKYWRMTCFGWDAADRFPAFLAKHGDAREYDPNEDEEGDVGESSEEDDSDQNEYESDGIDDATIDEESVNEDPDVDDLEIDNSQESEDEEDGGASEFGGFSPLRDEDGGSMLVDGDASAAQFSSPEPEAVGDRPRGRGGRPLVVLDDDDEEETEAQDSQPPARRRRREFINIDSEIDDEDDEEEQPAQSTTRRRRVVVSDDEDEDDEDEAEKPARPVGRRARVLPSDDEEEDEDEGGAEVGDDKTKDESDEEDEPSRTKKPLSLAETLQRNRRQNLISDEESEEEESSEEDAPPKKMSLAEQLMAHRRKNPIETESEPETEGTIGVDDTDDEEDEEEDEDEESGMFMNMAEEGESGDEQDEDDY
ncbi:hypothetical protein CKAH01_05316 [Colletotrichum kahawae]|uniref:2EXR domain-containing protein n=1 Tax=Colletotrichum kahawae TaxID=34407 RepID=A0AAD9YHE6_COLKA|nr:hypothetical protein CKAH01_05316 [Colletotrichum kahawae]